MGDNDLFNIAPDGITLRTTASFDFETKNYYYLWVRATDLEGLTFDMPFAIYVTDVWENSAPIAIELDNSSVPEKAGANAVIGYLGGADPNPGHSETLVFSLPAGMDDNALFNIAPDGSTLRANASFDYDAQNSYTVTVRATDLGGLTFDQQFTITVTEIPDTCTLTYYAGAHGSLIGESSQTVPYGEDGATVTAVPDPGYRFSSWSDWVTTASRTDLHVTADITVWAFFVPDVYTIYVGSRIPVPEAPSTRATTRWSAPAPTKPSPSRPTLATTSSTSWWTTSRWAR